MCILYAVTHLIWLFPPLKHWSLLRSHLTHLAICLPNCLVTLAQGPLCACCCSASPLNLSFHMANYRTIISSLHNCMGQAFMQLLNMRKQNATACRVTPLLLWAGKKRSRKRLGLTAPRSLFFPPAFKPFRPRQLGWKAWPHHQAICGLTEPLSAYTWAGEKPLGTSSLILVDAKGELLFEKGGLPRLSF